MPRVDTARELTRGSCRGRLKLSGLRRLATERGWLAAGAELPDAQSTATAV
jgi:hypothetical protein